MKKFVMLLAAGALAVSAFAGPGAPKKKAMSGKGYWVINVGLYSPTGDHEDAGVETGFNGSLDYFFGSAGENSNAEWYAGLGGFSGQGDNEFETRSYGVHVGVLFGLGKPGDDNPWAIDLRGGWYQSTIEGEVDITKGAGAFGTDTFDEDDSGFGGSVAIVYKSKGGPRFSLGWFMLPEVKDADNQGYFFNIGFPFGGK